MSSEQDRDDNRDNRRGKKKTNVEADFNEKIKKARGDPCVSALRGRLAANQESDHKRIVTSWESPSGDGHGCAAVQQLRESAQAYKESAWSAAEQLAMNGDDCEAERIIQALNQRAAKADSGWIKALTGIDFAEVAKKLMERIRNILEKVQGVLYGSPAP